MRKIFNHRLFQIICLLLLAALWKAWLLSRNVFPFNSDEAIIALMSRHILQGEHPIFFYGQAYMGSLDAYLAAFSFMIFGQKVLAIRIVQAFLYLLTLFSTFLIAKRGFDSTKTGILTLCLLVIPVVNTTLYTTVSLGGYGEALLIGNLILLVGIKIINQIKANGEVKRKHKGPEFIWPFILAFLTGLGAWVNGITLLYAVPVFIKGFLVFIQSDPETKKSGFRITFPALFSGFLAGIFPILIFTFQAGWAALLGEFFGSAVAIENTGFLMRSWSHLLSLLFLGLPVLWGFRPPWEMRWLVLPLIPLILFFWSWVIMTLVKNFKEKSPAGDLLQILGGILALNVLGFLFTSFGLDPSGRYFLPMVVPLGLAGGYALEKLRVNRFLKFLPLTLVILFNLLGTINCAGINPPGITTQFYYVTILDHDYDSELIDFLFEEEEYYGYSNYWVSYPIAFLSEEKLIYVPRLPYHLDFRYTSRDSRIEDYEIAVAAAEKVAYITTNNPALDTYLMEQFSNAQISWEYHEIGNYHVFYHLSDLIRPEEIGLGGYFETE